MKNNELYIIGHVCGQPRLVREATDTKKAKAEFVIIPNDIFDKFGNRNSIVISCYDDKADEVMRSLQSGMRIELISHIKSYEKKGCVSQNNKPVYGYEFILDKWEAIKKVAKDEGVDVKPFV